MSALNKPLAKKGRTAKFDIFVPTKSKPELILDPCAVDVIASFFRSVSQHTQVLVSTQSSAFVDSFEPGDIVVVQRNQEATEFERPQAEELDSWVEEYALGELREKDGVSVKETD